MVIDVGQSERCGHRVGVGQGTVDRVEEPLVLIHLSVMLFGLEMGLWLPTDIVASWFRYLVM